MKVYLAHNFAARVWLKDYIKLLELSGHECTSRWIMGAKFSDYDDAWTDLIDIERADAIILFTDQYGETPGKGKFLELGYALAKGKKCIIYGRDLDSSVFYALTEKAKTFEEAMEFLR